MFILFTGNKENNNNQVIVSFKNNSLADKFIAKYQNTPGYIRFNVDYLSDDIRRVEKNYKYIDRIQGYNTDKFCRKLLKHLER